MTTIKQKIKDSPDLRLLAIMFGGLILLFSLAFACYYFNIELTDLT
ncbi:MAG: hypothetical protein KBB50_02000 [Candidatus Pacebacteria bacterium]|jgi:hypothetical protein|nr:hypothetical protein [Candidatus Paceibacterota bacterium]